MDMGMVRPWSVNFVSHISSTFFIKSLIKRDHHHQYHHENGHQELSILQDSEDTVGECRAHGNLGAVHMSLGNNTLALR